MNKPDHTNTYTIVTNGKQFTFTHTGSEVVPEFSSVTSVSVIPFNEAGQIVAVRLRHRGIDFPGGHVEPGEATPEETMNREVLEEACMTIRSPFLVEVIGSDYYEHPTYMLLYGAYVDKLHEFVSSEEASERVAIDQDRFIEQYEAGNKRLMTLAIKEAWERLSTHDNPSSS